MFWRNAVHVSAWLAKRQIVRVLVNLSHFLIFRWFQGRLSKCGGLIARKMHDLYYFAFDARLFPKEVIVLIRLLTLDEASTTLPPTTHVVLCGRLS